MVEQTTLHNVLTCVIAVVIFVFQSLNYLIARIKDYVKHREKTTTVVTADTTISSDTQPNDNNALEDFIRVQELIQKHFDIPLKNIAHILLEFKTFVDHKSINYLHVRPTKNSPYMIFLVKNINKINKIVAEDEPNVNDSTDISQVSNNIRKEKNQSDQFDVDRFIDDSYVARGLGLIAATVGRQTDFYLYSKHDNDFENIVIELKGRNSEVGKITILDRNPVRSVALKSIPIDCRYDEDRIKVTYTPCVEGVHTLTLLRYGSPICRSPYYVSVEKSPTNSRSRIRLGTKKYKMVTKFGKGKYTPIETIKDNSTPRVIESNKPTVKSTVRPTSEESAIKTDVMSIVTKFESKNMNIKKMPQKRMTSITERNSEYDMIDTSPTTVDFDTKIKTSCKTNNADHVPSIRKMNSKFETVYGINLSHEVYAQSKEKELRYEKPIDIDEGHENKSIVTLNEHVETTNDALSKGNISPSQQELTSNVEVTLKNEDAYKTDERNQNREINELLEEEKYNEFLSDGAVVDPSKTDCMDAEPCVTQNKTSYFDDEDRKTVVVVENANERETQPNDFVDRQATDSNQYDIKQPPFTSIIKKITDSVCETCSEHVCRILSEFPKDINITHNKNTDGVRSSFETLLAQPIRININIDNVIENGTAATQEHKNTQFMRTDRSTNLEHVVTNVKRHSPNGIEFVGNRSEELQRDMNSVNTEPVIGRNKNDSEIISTTSAEEHKTGIPLAEQCMRTDVIHQQNILSADEIRECLKNEVSTISCNLVNDNIIHDSENKVESLDQNKQTSATKQNIIDLNKSNQSDEIIDRQLNLDSEVSVSASHINNLLIMNENENPKLILDEYESKSAKNEAISNENIEFESGNIDDTNYKKEALGNVSLDERESNEQKTSDVFGADNQNPISTIIEDKNQKLIMEKFIEPVLNNYFKKNMVRRVLQFCLKKDVSNMNDLQIFENDDTNPLDELRETKIDNATEINIENDDKLITGEENYDDKSENLENEKIDNKNLLKLIEQIIKTNVILNKNNAEIMAKTELHNIIHTPMNYTNDLQKNNSYHDGNERNSNYTQATIPDASNTNKANSNEANESKLEEQEKTENEQRMDNIETSFVDISSGQRIETPIEPQINSSEETVIMTDSQNEWIETAQEIELTANGTETITVKDIITYSDSGTTLSTQFLNLSETTSVEECNCMEIQALTDIQKSNNEEASRKGPDTAIETKALSVSEDASTNNKSSQELKTVNKIETSNATETDDGEKQCNEENQEPAAPEAVENITSDTIETTIINETKESPSTDEISIKSNTSNEAEFGILNNIKIASDEQQSTIVTIPNDNKTDDAKSFTVERETRIKLPSLNVREIIIVERPDSKNRGTTLDTLVLNGISTVKIEIDTSETQKSNAIIVLSIKDSKVVLQENISNVKISDEMKTKVVKESNQIETENLLSDHLIKTKVLNTKSTTKNVLTNNIDNECIEEEILKENDPIADIISSEIEIKNIQQLLGGIKETIPEYFTSTNTPAMTIEESIKGEEETSTLTVKEVNTEKIMDIQTENIVEELNKTYHATLPIKESVKDVKMLNTIQTEIDLQLSLTDDSPGEKKEIVAEMLTLTDSPSIPNKEAVNKEMKNLHSNPAIENSSSILVNESLNEIETLTIKRKIDLQLLPAADSSKDEREIVFEKSTRYDSSIISDEEAAKEEIEILHSNLTPKSSSPELTEDPVKEIETFTIKTEIDLKLLSTDNSPEDEKEIVFEKLTRNDSKTIPDEEAVNEEIEILHLNPTPKNSSPVPVEDPMEKITESSPANLITTDIQPIYTEEPIEMETLTATHTEIDHPLDQQAGESLEVEENCILTAEEPSIVLINDISAPFNLTETPVVPVEDIIEKEIDSSPSIICDSQVMLLETKMKLENENKSEGLTTSASSNELIEYQTNEEIESISMTPLENGSVSLLKCPVIDEEVTLTTTSAEKEDVFTRNITTTNVPILPIEELTEKEIEIITKPALLDSIPVLIEKLIEVKKENILKTLNATEIVTRPVETLTIIPKEIISQALPVEGSIKVKHYNIPKYPNKINSPVIPIKNQVKEDVDIKSENPAPVKESIDEYNNREVESFTDTSAIPINEPVIEKVDSLIIIQTNKKSPSLEKRVSSSEEKKIDSENITSTENPTIPIKEKIEILPTKPALEDFLILPVENLIEAVIGKHGNLNTADTQVHIVEKPILIGIENLTSIPAEIVSQVVVANELVEINKQNKPEYLKKTDKAHTPVEEPTKEETEDFLPKSFSIDSLPTKLQKQKPMDIETENISAYLSITEVSAIVDEEKILPEKSSPNDSLQSLVEEVVEIEKLKTLKILTTVDKSAIPIEEPVKIEKGILTTKPSINIAKNIPVEESMEVDLNYRPEQFTLNDTSIIRAERPEKKEKETIGSHPDPVVKLLEEERKNTLDNLTAVHTTITQVEERIKEEVISINMVPIESDSQVLPAETTLEIKRETALDNLTSTATKPFKKLLKVEIETLNTILTATNSQVSPTDETKDVEERITPEHSSANVLPVIPNEQLVKEEVGSITIKSDLSSESLNKPLELNNENLTVTKTSTTPIPEPVKEEIEIATTEPVSEPSPSLTIEEPMEIVNGSGHINLTIIDVVAKQIEEIVNINIESSTNTPRNIDLQVLPTEDMPEEEKEMFFEKLTTTDYLTTDEEIVKEKMDILPAKPVSKNTPPLSVEEPMEKWEESLPSNLTATDTLPTQFEELSLVEMETMSITKTDILSQILPGDESVKVEEGNLFQYSKITDAPVISTEELMKKEVESIIMTESGSPTLMVNELPEVEKKIVPDNKTKIDTLPTPIEETVKEVIEIIHMNSVEVPMEKIKANLFVSSTTADTPTIQIGEPKKIELETTSLTEIVSPMIPSEKLVQLENSNPTNSLTVTNTSDISIEYLTRVEIETSPKTPTLNNFLPTLVEKPTEPMKETIPTILPAEETIKIKGDTFTAKSTETISQELPAERSVGGKEKNITKLLDATDTQPIQIEEPVEIETLTTTPTDNFPLVTRVQILPTDDSPEYKKEIVSEKSTRNNSSTIPDEEAVKEEIEILHSNPTLKNSSPVLIEDPVKEIETITMKTEIDLKLLSTDDSPEDEKEIVSEKLTRNDSKTIPDEEAVKEEIEILHSNPTPKNSSPVPVEEPMENITESSPTNLITTNIQPIHTEEPVEMETLTATNTEIVPLEQQAGKSLEGEENCIQTAEEPSIVLIKDISTPFNLTETPVLPVEDIIEKEIDRIILIDESSKNEIESITKSSTDNDVHLPIEESSELEKKYILENLTTAQAVSVKEPTKEEIEILTMSPTKSNSLYLPTELSVNDKISNIPENVIAIDKPADPVEKPEINEVETILPRLISNDPLEVHPKDTLAVEEATISKVLIEYDNPTVTAKLINEVEIETLNFTDNQNIPVENTVHNEIQLMEENRSHTVPIEESTEVKKIKISENCNTSNSLASPIEDPSNDYTDTLTLLLTTSESEIVPFDNTMSTKKETIPENLKSNEIPTVPTEKQLKEEKENTAEGLKIIAHTSNITIVESGKQQDILAISTEINNPVVTVTELPEVKKYVISENVISAAPFNQSSEIGKETVPENVILIETPTKTTEESIKVEIQHVFENLNSNEIAVEPVKEPLDVEKESLRSDLTSNESPSAAVEEKLEIKEERIIITENVISSDTPTIPVEDVMKDKIETLSTILISSNSLPAQLEEPMEVEKENVHLVIPKTDTITLPIETPVNEVETLTITPINIDSQVFPAKDSPEIEKETVSKKFTPTDPPTIPNKEEVKKEIENIPKNPALENLSLIPVEESIAKMTENSPDNLITTDTQPIQIEEQMKEETKSITTTTTDIFTRVVPRENQAVVEKDYMTECLTLTDKDIPVKESKTEKIETSTTDLDGFLPATVEELVGLTKENVIENLTRTRTPMVLPTVKPLHAEKVTLTSTQTEIVPQAVPIVESIGIEENNTLIYLNTTDESMVLIEQPIEKHVKTLPTCSTLYDSSQTPAEQTLEEKKETLFTKCSSVGIKQLNTNQTLISDITKSLSIKHSSDECVDVELEKENIIVDDFNIDLIDNSRNVELLCEQNNDITFEPSNNVTTPNSGEDKQFDEQSDSDNNIVKTYCQDETVNIEKTNYNSQTSSIDDAVETENADIPSSFLEFGETSTAMLHSESESDLKENTFAIQKLEMSVHRMKTSDDDYFEKTFVQLEQTEKISVVENISEDENKTAAGDKLYTVNESDLNAILCASSLQEALTLLDSKIKFKFKHGTKKTSGKKNSAVHKSNMQTTSGSTSGKNTNFAEAREYFKTIEKKSKK